MRDQSVAHALGRRVRRMRQEQGLTLREIEGRSGVSATHVSEVERGKTSPTVGVLEKISTALGVRPGLLLEPAVEMPPLVRGAGQRRTLWLDPQGLSVEGLTQLHGSSEISAAIVHLPKGTVFQREEAHPGEEFCHVLAGALEIQLGEVPHVLAAGESIHFRATKAHAIRNATGAGTRFLWVCRPRASL